MPLEFLKRVRSMKNRYNKEFIRILSINFIFIVIFINGYSLGEKSLIDYFREHPKGVLICKIREHIHGESCKISYDRQKYIIKLKRNHEQKTIQLRNSGTLEKPIFKIILQGKWPSESVETKLFNQDSEVLFGRYPDNIHLNIQYNRGISEYFDRHFYTYISIEFKDNSDLKKYETEFTHLCLYSGGINEFKKEVLSTNKYKYPQIDTLNEIDTIYWHSYHEICLPKSYEGCYVKSILLSRIIKDIYPDYPPPIGLLIENPDLAFDDSLLGRVEWQYHFVLFYVNKEDQKIYILDPFFLDDGVIEFDDWNRRINSGNNDKTKFEIYQIEE